VEGEKHFLLFDPRAAEGLYAFPVSHPYDEYAMVDLQNVDTKSFPLARNVLEKRGAVATLRPGEALFIPTHWWHHVQGTAACGSWSISVNFWFAIHKVLMESPHPFPQHLELELARHVELLLSDVGGSASVGVLARDLRKDAENAEPKDMDEAFFAVRLFLLDRLAALLGAGN
ncbi:Hif1an, partial [Symbiodinium pilosum]